MKMFCIFIEAFFNFVYWGEEKMMQNGQTEPEGGTRTRTWVRGEVKFVRSKKA